MGINSNLFLQLLLLNLTSSLYYLNRQGSESLPSADQQYQAYNVPKHQPPFQVIDRNNHQRRLDVWVPLDDTEEDPKTTTTTTKVPRHVGSYNKVAPVYQRPAIPKSNPSVIQHIKSSKPTPVFNRNEIYERRSDNAQQHQFSDILNHLENYKRDDNYNPNHIPRKTIIPTTNRTPKPKPTRPSEEPQVLNEITEASRYQKRAPLNIFPQVKRKDVVNVLQSISQTQKLVGRTMQPIVDLFRNIANSFSLDLIRRQSVEEIFETDRQDSTPIVDAILDPINELIDNLTENPEPPIIIATVLLSLVTGQVVGNTITDTANAMIANENSNATNVTDFTHKHQNCPMGYELVYVDYNGAIYAIENGMDTDDAESGNDMGMDTGIQNDMVTGVGTGSGMGNEMGNEMGNGLEIDRFGPFRYRGRMKRTKREDVNRRGYAYGSYRKRYRKKFRQNENNGGNDNGNASNGGHGNNGHNGDNGHNGSNGQNGNTGGNGGNGDNGSNGSNVDHGGNGSNGGHGDHGSNGSDSGNGNNGNNGGNGGHGSSGNNGYNGGNGNVGYGGAVIIPKPSGYFCSPIGALQSGMNTEIVPEMGTGMVGGSEDGNGCSGGTCGGGGSGSNTHGSGGIGITVNADGNETPGPAPSHISISFKDTQLIIAKKGTMIPGVDIQSGKVIPFNSAGLKMT